MSTGVGVRGIPGGKPNVKVYVIDPKKFQQDPKTVVTAVNKHNDTVQLFPKRRILPTSTIAKENRKDEEVEALLSVPFKVSKTRAGRVTKSPVTAQLSTDASSTISVAAKIRRRDPPEFFRCQTCQKFYVGNARLKAHLKKYPTHHASTQYLKTLGTSVRNPTHMSVAVQAEHEFLVGNHFVSTSPKRPISQVDLTNSQSPYLIRTGPGVEPVLSTPTQQQFNEIVILNPIQQQITQFQPLVNDFSGSNSLGSPAILRFQESQETVNAGPSPNPPYWNVFNFNSREESSPSGSESVTAPLRKDEQSMGISTDLNPSISYPIKTIWDVVERKLFQNGINQILVELSDVADKLGKIARDKIIPIREDEEERLPNSTPIVRVENGFLSHLLDLSFGSYVFREDGGIRRRPMPPPATDLSLTAGEVDIDKFLSCDMEMDLSLPHLTNLDIASICNN